MGAINNLIYFDNNGTTRMDERVEKVMHATVQVNAEQMKQESKLKISRLIHCSPDELFFTRGITDSIHVALAHIFDAYRQKGDHIIASCIEHQEVLKALEYLKTKGADVTFLEVDKEGLIDPEALEAAIRPSTIAVCIMAANNHTGVIQPLEKISEICQRHGSVFFSDASQFAGKMRCDVSELLVDGLAFGSHKMHGPKEIGVIYARKGTALHQHIKVTYQEPVFEDPRIMAGFAKATEIFEQDYWENSAHVSKIKNYFEHQLLDIEGLRINGSTRHRIYNTSNLTFPPEKNVGTLSGQFKFLSYKKEYFYVLKAMGIGEEEIPNTFRFSFGKYNTLDEVKFLVEAIMKL